MTVCVYNIWDESGSSEVRVTACMTKTWRFWSQNYKRKKFYLMHGLTRALNRFIWLLGDVTSVMGQVNVCQEDQQWSDFPFFKCWHIHHWTTLPPARPCGLVPKTAVPVVPCQSGGLLCCGTAQMETLAPRLGYMCFSWNSNEYFRDASKPFQFHFRRIFKALPLSVKMISRPLQRLFHWVWFCSWQPSGDI